MARASRPLAALVVLCCAVALAPANGAAPPGTAAADFPVQRVRPGLRGYAITAGPGDTLERFPVIVLGVQDDAGPGFPLVLIRASGEFIDASGGVAAGMSGSPVYLGTPEGDALLGAIGYVFPSADHHLALVTPIGAMRDAADGGGAPGPGPVALPGLGEPVPAATPVLLGGVGARAAALLEPLFRDARVAPFPVEAAGTLPEDAQEDRPLVPGSAISVQLLRGDVTIGAVGTLTAVEGARVLAFGHPLLGQGAVTLALAPARVTAIVASDTVPFKLVNSGRSVLGSIRQDRPAAIAGSLGAGPAMIPVSLTITGVGPNLTHHLEVVPDGRMYAPLVASATLELLDRALSRRGAGFAEVAWDLTLASGERVTLLDQVDAEDDVALAAARLSGAPLALLADNAFRTPGLSRVALNVRLSLRRNAADIADVVAENPRVLPGEPLVAHLRLQPYRREAEVKTLTIALPEDVTGELTLTVRGAQEPVGDADEPPDPEKEPRSFAELLDALRTRPQASEVIVELPDPNGGPPRRLLRVPLPYVVHGTRTLDVTVAPGPEPASGDSAAGAAGATGGDAGEGGGTADAP